MKISKNLSFVSNRAKGVKETILETKEGKVSTGAIIEENIKKIRETEIAPIMELS